MLDVANFVVETKLDITKSAYERKVEEVAAIAAGNKPWWKKLPFFANARPRASSAADTARQAEIEARLAKWYAHSPPDRLSSAEIEDFSKAWTWEELERHRQERKSSYAERPIELTFQGMLFPLIRRVVALDPSVKSILAIGCRYAYDLHLIGKEFPLIKLSGVDLHVGLDRLNEEFPEIEIHQGYALEMIERGEIGADICTFVSTATCFKPRELDAYFQALAKQSRYQTVHFIHNYKAAAERAGFKVIHHRAYKPGWTDVYRLEMVATTA